MSQQFNLRPPVNSPVVDKNNRLTQEWQNFFTQLFLFFQQDFSQNNVAVPDIPTTTINALTPQKGWIFYDSTTDEWKGYNGAIVTFNTTP